MARLIEETAVEGCLAWGAWSGMEIFDQGDLLWTMTAVPFPLFNSVLFSRLGPGVVEGRVRDLQSLARGRGVPLAWFTTPLSRPEDLGERLQSMGFFLGGVTAGMAMDLSLLRQPLPPPPGLVVEEVGDARAFREWSMVMLPVFQFPDYAFDPWVDMHAALGFGPERPWRHYLLRLQGRPVATSSLFLGSRACMVASVAVLPEHRRQGIGSAAVLAPLLEARRLGKRLGTLCSSDMGQGIYRRLGFQEHCRMNLYLWMND
ncbi:MAG: GNAT family N-acetyltransferase [Methanosarcinales archaeon]|nr:GNAT family N-acetyltransferase [Methanosarcinales archaeon]